MERVPQQPLLAYAVGLAGIGALSAMDAVMKHLTLGLGAFATMCWRSLLAVAALALPYALFRRGWPARATLRIHALRGAIMVPMSFLFFWGLARVPMAQAIALTFVAPLVALFLAAAWLGEPVGRRTLGGTAIAAAGVAVIFVGQGQADLGREALMGSLSVLGSAALYAFNIVLMRRQAQRAGPLEIAFYQFLFGALGFWLAALAAGIPPLPHGQWGALALATLLAIAGMLLLAFAYARAGAGYLASTEYSGFLYAMLFGWLFFAETVSPFTLAGAALIVGGCFIAARAVEHPTLETAA